MKDFADAAGSMRALMNANDIARFRNGNIKMSQQIWDTHLFEQGVA